jgi:outer membrane protein OmpA-like peptidoglycan-associated protein
MRERQRYSKPKEAESGSITRRQAKTQPGHRSDLPRRVAPASLTGLPQRLWHAGNRAIAWLLGRQRGSGQPLAPETQAQMEQAFDADFRDVRVHRDSTAQATAASLDATALTHGDDVYLGADAPASESPAGKKLLAHELAHVVQQRRADGQQTGTVNQPADAFEADADHAAAATVTGQPVQVEATGAPPAVQRQEREGGASAEQLLRDLLNKALEEGISYSEEGWKVGGVPVQQIPRGVELIGRLLRGDVQGAIEMFRPRDPRERERLQEETRRLRRELERWRPVEERQREEAQLIAEAARRASEQLGLGRQAPGQQGFRLREPTLDLPSSGLQPGTTTHWVLDRFRLESAALEPHHRRQLNDLATQANSDPNAELEIVGHADTTGALAFNQSLSERRANAVCDYLLRRGVEASKIKSVTGRGEEEPLFEGRTADDQARNRRVEISFRAGVTQRTESRFGLPPLRLEPD